MARSERLLALLQALRRRRRPVSGRVLADELGVSLRTLYRDIASLQGQGAEIEGEAGLGYVLKPGFWLPPLMLSGEEIEALVLGARWVGARTDESLALAAHDAIAKISAVLPPRLREDVEASTLIVPPSEAPGAATLDLAPIRAAIRAERKLAVEYCDAHRAKTERTIWAVRRRIFRGGARRDGLVRAQAGIPPFPRRSDRFVPNARGALSAEPPSPAQGLARRMPRAA